MEGRGGGEEWVEWRQKRRRRGGKKEEGGRVERKRHRWREEWGTGRRERSNCTVWYITSILLYWPSKIRTSQSTIVTWKSWKGIVYFVISPSLIKIFQWISHPRRSVPGPFMRRTNSGSTTLTSLQFHLAANQISKSNLSSLQVKAKTWRSDSKVAQWRAPFTPGSAIQASRLYWYWTLLHNIKNDPNHANVI